MKDFLEQLNYSLDITPVESYHYLFDQFRAHSDPHANDGDGVVVFPLVYSHEVGHTLLSVPL